MVADCKLIVIEWFQVSTKAQKSATLKHSQWVGDFTTFTIHVGLQAYYEGIYDKVG